MLAKLADELPAGGGFSIRAEVGRLSARLCFAAASDVFIQSRDLRPLDRYFPELHDVFLDELPHGCVVDGEIVIATPRGPGLRRAAAAAASGGIAGREAGEGDAGRRSSPSICSALGRPRPPRRRRSGERRARARAAARRGAGAPIHLTPMTRDRAVAVEWLARFEGAGLDGVIAKPEDGIVPARQARDDQDQARAHRRLRGGRLPLAQEREGHAGRLAAARPLRRRRHACTTSASPRRSRWRSARQLAAELAPLRERALDEPSVARVGRRVAAAR